MRHVLRSHLLLGFVVLCMSTHRQVNRMLHCGLQRHACCSRKYVRESGEGTGKRRKVYTGHRLRASRKGPLTSKLARASPEGTGHTQTGKEYSCALQALHFNKSLSSSHSRHHFVSHQACSEASCSFCPVRSAYKAYKLASTRRAQQEALEKASFTLITQIRHGVLLVTLLIPINLFSSLGGGDTWCLGPSYPLFLH
eukprot:1150341-Pelagomonas_calceolata.AAC.1